MPQHGHSSQLYTTRSGATCSTELPSDHRASTWTGLYHGGVLPRGHLGQGNKTLSSSPHSRRVNLNNALAPGSGSDSPSLMDRAAVKPPALQVTHDSQGRADPATQLPTLSHGGQCLSTCKSMICPGWRMRIQDCLTVIKQYYSEY